MQADSKDMRKKVSLDHSYLDNLSDSSMDEDVKERKKKTSAKLNVKRMQSVITMSMGKSFKDNKLNNFVFKMGHKIKPDLERLVRVLERN